VVVSQLITTYGFIVCGHKMLDSVELCERLSDSYYFLMYMDWHWRAQLMKNYKLTRLFRVPFYHVFVSLFLAFQLRFCHVYGDDYYDQTGMFCLVL
jgi:hypothetical protein